MLGSQHIPCLMGPTWSNHSRMAQQKYHAPRSRYGKSSHDSWPNSSETHSCQGGGIEDEWPNSSSLEHILSDPDMCTRSWTSIAAHMCTGTYVTVCAYALMCIWTYNIYIYTYICRICHNMVIYHENSWDMSLKHDIFPSNETQPLRPVGFFHRGTKALGNPGRHR